VDKPGRDREGEGKRTKYENNAVWTSVIITTTFTSSSLFCAELQIGGGSVNFA
jgi:hypothetical protein